MPHLSASWLAAAAAACLFAAPACAGPIVAPGSTYGASVFDSVTPGFSFGVVRFDGVAEALTIGGGRPATLNESQTDLGGGQYRISFVFASTVDLFPTVGETGFVNIGDSIRPLFLLGNVDLVSASLTMFNGADVQVAARTTAFPGVRIWDGFYPTAGVGTGIGNVGGQDVRRITLDIVVAEVPEPGTFGLAGLALFGVAAGRRRRGD